MAKNTPAKWFMYQAWTFVFRLLSQCDLPLETQHIHRGFAVSTKRQKKCNKFVRGAKTLHAMNDLPNVYFVQPSHSGSWNEGLHARIFCPKNSSLLFTLFHGQKSNGKRETKLEERRLAKEDFKLKTNKLDGGVGVGVVQASRKVRRTNSTPFTE